MGIFKHTLFKVLIVVTLIFVGLSFALVVGSRKIPRIEHNNLLIQPDAQADRVPASTQSEIHSSDGTMKLVARREYNKDNTTTYSFFVSDSSGKNERPLFTKTVGETESISIPENSWSPDNKYVYIKDSKDGASLILVFKTSGEAFSSGQQFLDVVSLFRERHINYAFKEVTGWDSPPLLRVTTALPSGANGPSFWFDVESQSFIQLVR